ncbi:hypothetical protein HY969_01535 [Candidatus Kaiserbacteria bacterium]|nr:hypothetical protein [Candidatus Kaiserbacteria bacterium]
MAKPGIVHIVHHVDAEGPLFEEPAETLKRIETTFGTKLPFPKTGPTLQKLQRGELTVDGIHAAKMQAMLDPHTLHTLGTWKQVRAMLKRVTAREFRMEEKDSFGGGWVFNWHVMDHVGFKTNERGRDLGYLKIFNVYEKMLAEDESRRDAIHWHFHPISHYKEAHIPATSYDNSYREIHEVLCRRLIEKKWFPRVNRAGFHSERPDSNWFLEQWIPFDASNQSIEMSGEEQRDAINGRFGDWAGAPSDWSMYHPDLYDWRKKGNARRVIARALNMRSRFRNINEHELKKAFSRAEKGENIYVGITNHDWRDMEVEIRDFRKLLISTRAEFPTVEYKFSESVDAFRSALGLAPDVIQGARIDLDCTLQDDVLVVKVTNGEPFGPQPYLAIKTKKGEYFHDNFDFGVFKKTYMYTLDRYTVETKDIDTIAIASNDLYGNTCICNIRFHKNSPSTKHFL